ncbi:MAG: ATP-binding cassette domain-containing protein [Pseudomonadota bacterium]
MTAAESSASQGPATLELHALGVRRAGRALLAGLSLSSSAARIGLIGDWSALFQALTGEAEIAAGTARIAGHELSHALASGEISFAPCDVLLPPSFTIAEYLQHAARLGHGSRARALRDAEQVMQEYGLVEFAKCKLSQLASYQQRALGIAAAALSAPRVMCLETPLRGLETEPADYIARLCGVAAQRCRIIVSSVMPASPSPERALLDGCEELFWLEHGALFRSGSPAALFAPGAHYALTVKGAQIPAFLAGLNAAGCQVNERDGAGRYWALLPSGASADLLLDAALAAELVVLELEPLLVAR